ncbi:MAG TPA: hypothetical protein VIM30_09695 [Candidatus Limnocylindrales bacterium]|jgi:hypothetical protein
MATWPTSWTRGRRACCRFGGRGFAVEAWTVPEESTFVWLLGYSGPGSFEDADAGYYASGERPALDPDPAQWIVDNRTMWLHPVAPARPRDRRLLYRTAVWRTISGRSHPANPDRIARGARNRIVGRARVRAGFWRLVSGVVDLRGLVA